MTNRIQVFGHLGRDCEVQDINGKRVLILNIASNHKVKGEDVTVWRRVTFWNDSHRKMEQYLTKGASVMVYGEEQPPRVYEGKAQLEVIGRDISFNPFGGKKKEEGATPTPPHPTDPYVAKPAKEDPSFLAC